MPERQSTTPDWCENVELDAEQIQLLVCALAGNHPPRLAHLRMGVLRKLAKAERNISLRLSHDS